MARAGTTRHIDPIAAHVNMFNSTYICARTHTKIIQPTPLPSPLILPQMQRRHHVRYQSPRSARKEVTPSNKAVLQTTDDQAMLCHAYANAQMECENMVKGTKTAAAVARMAAQK